MNVTVVLQSHGARTTHLEHDIEYLRHGSRVKAVVVRQLATLVGLAWQRRLLFDQEFDDINAGAARNCSMQQVLSPLPPSVWDEHVVMRFPAPRCHAKYLIQLIDRRRVFLIQTPNYLQRRVVAHSELEWHVPSQVSVPHRGGVLV